VPVVLLLIAVFQIPRGVRAFLAPAAPVEVVAAKAEARPPVLSSEIDAPAAVPKSAENTKQKQEEWITGFFYIPGRGMAAQSSSGRLYDRTNPDVVAFGFDLAGRYSSVILSNQTLRMRYQYHQR